MENNKYSNLDASTANYRKIRSLPASEHQGIKNAQSNDRKFKNAGDKRREMYRSCVTYMHPRTVLLLLPIHLQCINMFHGNTLNLHAIAACEVCELHHWNSKRNWIFVAVWPIEL